MDGFSDFEALLFLLSLFVVVLLVAFVVLSVLASIGGLVFLVVRGVMAARRRLNPAGRH